MLFLVCFDCRRPYLIPAFAWEGDLYGVEFIAGMGDEREFCRNHHRCEIAPVVESLIVRGSEEDPLKDLAFKVWTLLGPVTINKTRRSLEESPIYAIAVGGSCVPAALLSA